MLFVDFAGRRSAVRLDLVQRIETIYADAIETVSSTARAVVDGAILPLVGLPEGPLPVNRVRTLRLSDGACDLLYAVREIDDAVALEEELRPVAEDPLVEAVTLVEGRTVTLIDGHELFARHGEPRQSAGTLKCYLPDDDWARTILAPLVEAAGYEAVIGEATDDGVAIILDDNAAQNVEGEDGNAVIRLRNEPQASNNANSIYRYDREGLLAALRLASAGRQG